MNTKSLVYIGLFIGSTFGGFIPSLWGASPFSFSSILLSAVGGIVGIMVGYRFGE